MFAKAVVISALFAAAHAGVVQPQVSYLSNPSVGVGGSNTYRGVAGLSSITHQAKAVDSAFSTVRKTDTRVTNDAVAYAQPQVAYAAQPQVAYAQPAPVAYAAPSYAYAQPQYTQYAHAVAQPALAPAPVAYAQPAYAAAPAVAYGTKTVSASPVAYAQPAYAAAPVQYAQQAPVAYAQQAPVAYAQPAPVAYAQQAPVAYAQPAYAAAPAVAYGSKTISAAPVAYAQPAYAAGPAPIAYAQGPAVYAKQPVAKFAQVARAVPLTKTAPATNLLGVAFSPISPQTATLHFNGFGTSYSLF